MFVLIVRTWSRDGLEIATHYGLFGSRKEAWRYCEEQKFKSLENFVGTSVIEITLVAKPCVEITIEGGIPERVDGIRWIDATCRDYDVEGFDDPERIETDGNGDEFIRVAL